MDRMVLKAVQDSFPGISLPGVARDVQKKLQRFKSALE